jgi:hypothetical protein
MKGFAMEPLDEPIPYLEDVNLSLGFGGSWLDWQRTPEDVRQVYLLVLEAREAARRSEEKK